MTALHTVPALLRTIAQLTERIGTLTAERDNANRELVAAQAQHDNLSTHAAAKGIHR